MPDGLLPLPGSHTAAPPPGRLRAAVGQPGRPVGGPARPVVRGGPASPYQLCTTAALPLVLGVGASAVARPVWQRSGSTTPRYVEA
jgi:hypothetical protein